MIAETDAAYIAGIIDGEGHIECVRRKEKRKGKTGDYISNSMRICIRVQMTDKSVLLWMREVIGMGTVRKRNRSASIKSHQRLAGVPRPGFAPTRAPLPALGRYRRRAPPCRDRRECR